MIAPAAIPSPASNGFSIGPFFFHAYGIAYVFAVAAAIFISRRRWGRVGGDPELCYEIAMWAFPAGLIGGRIYFDITTPSQIPDHWWGIFAIWDGGLGIWGGIAAGVAVGLWVAHRRLGRADLLRFMDAAAPGLLVAQAIGRIGNYFNQELFGAPSSLPWALKISPPHRPPGYLHVPTFEPTFLYELIWNLLLAVVPGVAGLAAQDPRAGPVRPLRGRLLGLSHLRGDPADRLLQPHLRPAPELLRRLGPVPARAAVVRGGAEGVAGLGRHARPRSCPRARGPRGRRGGWGSRALRLPPPAGGARGRSARSAAGAGGGSRPAATAASGEGSGVPGDTDARQQTAIEEEVWAARAVRGGLSSGVVGDSGAATDGYLPKPPAKPAIYAPSRPFPSPPLRFARAA